MVKPAMRGHIVFKQELKMNAIQRYLCASALACVLTNAGAAYAQVQKIIGEVVRLEPPTFPIRGKDNQVIAV